MPLSDTISALLNTPEPADLGAHPRGGTMSVRDVNARLDEAFCNATISEGSQQLTSSTAPHLSFFPVFPFTHLG